MTDLIRELNNLADEHKLIADKFDVEEKSRVLAELKNKTMADDFWSDEDEAREVMQELAQFQSDIDQIEDLKREINESIALIDMSKSEEEIEGINAEIEAVIARIKKQLYKLQIRLFLSGDYDKGNALISIHAGQGGVEAMDWAAMLKRMYIRYAERNDWKYQIVSESMGEEAGIKAVTILIEAHWAYGYLKHEAGTHRLVRLSPFNSDNLRQTSFALVEVLPQIKKGHISELRADDLEWDFYRSSGKGGQNVNKVSTAVRLKHIPSGIVVECQAERTQVQNRKLAESLLLSKLWEREEKENQDKLSQLKGGAQTASWGTQIRNYVLHPYQLVKDLRTQVETSSTQSVLDGDLDDFVQAGIRHYTK